MTINKATLDAVTQDPSQGPQHLTTLRRPRRDSLRRSNAILGAARELFLAQGYSGTNMDAIAERAQVSKRTVYSHWGSKENLFFAMLQDLCADILPAEMAKVPNSAAPVEDRLLRAGMAFLQNIFSDEQIRLLREVISESRTAPEVGRMMSEGPVRVSRLVMQAILQDAHDRGDLLVPDTDRAARQFLALMKTDVHLKLLLGYEVDTSEPALREIVTSCVAVFVNGCRA